MCCAMVHVHHSTPQCTCRYTLHVHLLLLLHERTHLAKDAMVHSVGAWYVDTYEHLGARDHYGLGRRSLWFLLPRLWCIPCALVSWALPVVYVPRGHSM